MNSFGVMVRARVRVVIGLQPTKTRAELDSSTVFETNILRVSPVNNNTNKVGTITRVYEKPFCSAAIKP